jgi:putative ABC transport system permease protein
MTWVTLIRRGLSFHRRAHLGVVLGAAVGTAALVGALVVGDSVRESLRDMALMRLGNVETAMASGERLFRSQLGGQEIAAVLQLPAIAATPDASARANHVQVLGVTEAFWKLGEQPPGFGVIPPDTVVLNEPLARQLNAKIGDTILVRVGKPSLLSRDAPVSPQEDYSLALRLKVQAVVSDEQFGRFSLQANQIAPFNAFVNLSQLQQKIGQTNRANLLLVPSIYEPVGLPQTNPPRMFRLRFSDFISDLLPSKSKPKPSAPGIQLLLTGHSAPLEIPENRPDDSDGDATDANLALRASWSLEDADLRLRELPSGGVELRSDRIFLDPPVVDAVQRAFTNSLPLLTYLVNEIRDGDKSTPYSMVTAMGAPIVPPDMRDDEIIINDWLANDLGAKVGDTLALTYYVIGNGRALELRTNSFRVHSVVPLAGAAADRGLMPDFPGVAQAESAHDWDAGFPIKFDKIRPQDDQYWRDHRGTPKAFVTLLAGCSMWANRFGDLTAIRFPPGDGPPATVESNILKTLDPASLGLKFEPVRAQALAASSQAQDFGGLFIGFSFFLIVAALLLMALLFQFGLEQRATEAGTLLALGFPPHQVRRLFLSEGIALAFIGGVLGAVGGLVYARLMLQGLTTIWRGAVGTSALRFHATPASILTGLFASTLVAIIVIWLGVRKQARQPARELLAEGALDRAMKFEQRKRKRGAWFAWAAAIAAIGMAGEAMWTGNKTSAETFFIAGTLLLMAGLGFCDAWLASLAGHNAAPAPGLTALGFSGAARRPKRSLATIGLLACGAFLIIAVGAFRLDATPDAAQRSSGTGGFALIGESTLPVTYDLNSPAGRDFYGLNSTDMTGVQVVPFRVRDGDEASCLNLNRALTPRLLGVNPDLLQQRNAFTFADVMKGLLPDKRWLLLRGSRVNPDTAPPADEIPAIGDENSIVWALGKKIGDTVDYTDGQGRKFKLRLVGALANSVLQGSLVIDEAEFIKRFPGETGYRMFLVDAPSNSAPQVAASLTRALQNAGLELTPAVQRLNEFNAVQNTYLSTFQVLGGLGLLLGSAGLGVVVLRNVQNRRGELALLLAVGFRRRAVQRLVLTEHALLLALGVGVGVLAAVVGTMPALLSPGSRTPYASLTMTLIVVLLNGFLWTWLATRLALRGRLLDALRNE